VIVTQAVMSVPALVMKIFVPLTIHSPSQLGGRAGCAGVGAGARLGQAERRELSTGGELGQPLLLLLLGPEVEDRQRPQRVVRGDGDRDRGVDPRQLFDGDRVRDRVGAGAAVLLGNRHPHQPELGQLGDEVVGEPVLPVELSCDRSDPRLRELAHGLTDELLLRRQVEVQVDSLSASSQIRRTP
jgi:hypothetical protein